MSLSDLVFVGASLQFVGGLTYIRLTIKGITKPNRMTWFLWSVAPMIGTVAAVSDGVGWAILPVFMAGFTPLLVFLSSYVNPASYWKLGKFDYYCGAFSVTALIFWWITSEPLLAILLAATADGLAALPTLKKAWKYPETESSIIFAIMLVSIILSIFAIEEWRLSEYLFSAYLFVINLSLVLAIHRKQIFKTYIAE